ncbi:MAG: hypothetical protein HGB21_12875, partial [Nitrospirae bacterium]|nr:hypothetical protein [Nitrospirota bacterium]
MKSTKDIVLPVLAAIGTGKKTIEISELWGGSRALFLFQLFRESKRPLLVVTANEEEATVLSDDLRFFADTLPGPEGTSSKPEILTFPAWGVLPFEADSPDSSTVGERMRFLYHLISGTSGIYLAPVASLIQKLMPWDLFADSVKTISTGQQMDPAVLSNALAASGYEHAAMITRVGEFSRRGGIIDFFSPTHDTPIRVEFFGDTIDSLRAFDLETQRSLGEIKQAVALPVRELIVTDAGIERFEKQTNITTDEHGSDEEQSKNDIVGQIKLGILPPGSEFLAPFFYDMEDLFRYLP